MRKITINVDDNAKVISVTTFSEFETYCNANAMVFDIRNTDEVTMPEIEPLSNDNTEFHP